MGETFPKGSYGSSGRPRTSGKVPSSPAATGSPWPGRIRGGAGRVSSGAQGTPGVVRGVRDYQVNATHMMMLAVILFVIHRWATGQTAVSPQIIIAGAFVIICVALMDQGRMQPVAHITALIFLAIAAINAVPALASAAKASPQQATPASGQISAGPGTGQILD